MGRKLKQREYFFKEDIHMAKKKKKPHMERSSKLLIIREMQLKTTMQYQITPVSLAIIKKSTNDKCWRRCEEKGMLLDYWWECKFVHPL